MLDTPPPNEDRFSDVREDQKNLCSILQKAYSDEMQANTELKSLYIFRPEFIVENISEEFEEE